MQSQWRTQPTARSSEAEMVHQHCPEISWGSWVFIPTHVDESKDTSCPAKRAWPWYHGSLQLCASHTELSATNSTRSKGNTCLCPKGGSGKWSIASATQPRQVTPRGALPPPLISGLQTRTQKQWIKEQELQLFLTGAPDQAVHFRLRIRRHLTQKVWVRTPFSTSLSNTKWC